MILAESGSDFEWFILWLLFVLMSHPVAGVLAVAAIVVILMYATSAAVTMLGGPRKRRGFEVKQPTGVRPVLPEKVDNDHG